MASATGIVSGNCDDVINHPFYRRPLDAKGCPLERFNVRAVAHQVFNVYPAIPFTILPSGYSKHSKFYCFIKGLEGQKEPLILSLELGQKVTLTFEFKTIMFDSPKAALKLVEDYSALQTIVDRYVLEGKLIKDTNEHLITTRMQACVKAFAAIGKSESFYILWTDCYKKIHLYNYHEYQNKLNKSSIEEIELLDPSTIMARINYKEHPSKTLFQIEEWIMNHQAKSTTDAMDTNN